MAFKSLQQCQSQLVQSYFSTQVNSEVARGHQRSNLAICHILGKNTIILTIIPLYDGMQNSNFCFAIINDNEGSANCFQPYRGV